MVTESCHVLTQGDCKNAFCNAKLPDKEVTIIKPPSGNPDSRKDVFWLPKKTLYGLGRSLRHWHKMINSIFVDMGLVPSIHGPCLYQGVPSSKKSPADPTGRPLHMGLCVDDFVYYSKDTSVKQRFESFLAAKTKVEFMGTVNWFLGTYFEWPSHQDGALSVHLSQEAYAQHIAEKHHLSGLNYNPRATPYRSGCPIDSIPLATVNEDNNVFVKRQELCQSLVGCLNWLAMNTRPDL